MPNPKLWGLVNVEVALDRWEEIDNPEADLRVIVLNWLLSRLEDPYQGVYRVPGFPNLWFGAVPRTQRRGHQVVCSYRIEENSRQVICDNIAVLRLPL